MAQNNIIVPFFNLRSSITCLTKYLTDEWDERIVTSDEMAVEKISGESFQQTYEIWNRPPANSQDSFYLWDICKNVKRQI